MIVRCAWCKRIITNKPPYGGKYDRSITDGICDDCLLLHFPHHYDKVKGSLGVSSINDIYKRKERSLVFKCLECEHEGEQFHAEVAIFYKDTYLYRAKCPKCGSTKVDVIGSIKEQSLRISIERR